MKLWRVDYVEGTEVSVYKVKYVYARTPEQAIRLARVENIVDLTIVV